MADVTHRKRVVAALAGRVTDRPAISLWRHFGGLDMTPQGLSEAMLAFQATYDFDFVKFMPTGTYTIIDWGAETIWEPNDHGIRTVTSLPIKSAADWPRLEALDTTRGIFGDVNRALELTIRALGPETPVLQTIFSPLATARKLGGPATLAHMRQHTEAFATGMSVIEGVTARLISDAIERGADLFYVLQSASADILTAAEVDRWERAYAERLLANVPSETIVLLHSHGDHLWFNDLADWPVTGLNWHDQGGGPTLSEARTRTQKGLVGGLDAWTVLRSGTTDDVERAVRTALASVPGGLVIGPGCVIPTDSAPHLIAAARRAVEPIAAMAAQART
jgi:uroporphyrinogen decarboxylase